MNLNELQDFLITQETYSEELLKYVDEIYSKISNDIIYITFTKPLVVWRGDITKLNVDAIVNAANDKGLGCFQPKHKCIDNIIHRKAGPRLRMECREKIIKRGFDLSCGNKPIITNGYFTGAKYIIHVTGPNLLIENKIENKNLPSIEDEIKLKNCYLDCLDIALQTNIKTIAFCCISTGLFGFPKKLASNIAISTVKDWLNYHPGAISTVIFCVYTDEDEFYYNNYS